MPVELSFDRFEGTAGGPQLVVLHGLFGSRRNWRAVAQDLAAREDARQNIRGRRPTVFTVDLRHHGNSPNKGPFNLEEMAEDVCAFIEGHAGGGQVTLLGHSLGGKVAVLALQQCPQLIERLILVDITPFRLPEALCSDLQGVVQSLQALQASPAALKGRRAAEELLGRRITAPGVVQFLLQNLRRSGDGRLRLQLGVDAIAADFHEACRAVLPAGKPDQDPAASPTGVSSASVEDRAPWRNVPLVTIKGGGSEYMPAEHVEALSCWFRMHDHRSIEKAGHWLHVERKEDFLAVLTDVFGGFAGKT